MTERKRSWKEIDASRNKSKSRSDRSSDKNGLPSHAYSKYKAQLDKLFTPGGAALPEHFKEKLGPTSDTAANQRTLLDQLRRDPCDKTLKEYTDAGFELPPDIRMAISLLGTIKDEALIGAVLKAICNMVDEGKKPNAQLLKERLTALEVWVEEPETRSQIDTLRSLLR